LPAADFNADLDYLLDDEAFAQSLEAALDDEMCRRSFIHFVRRMAPDLIIEEYHLLMAELFEQLVFGEVDRAMVFASPGSTKSQFCSRLLPAFAQGHDFTADLMVCSYKKELAEGFGGQVRDTYADPDYRAVFPEITLRRGVKARGQWQLEAPAGDALKRRGGIFTATGVTTGTAGRRFRIGVLDDMLSEQDKDSKVKKDRAWSYYTAGFLTRAHPLENAILLTNTRYAPDDPAGRLLEQQREMERILAEAKARNAEAVERGEPAEAIDDLDYFDRWKVLSLPALVDKDLADRLNAVRDNPILWEGQQGERWPRSKLPPFKAGMSFAPRRFPLPRLLRMRNQSPARDWAALYMQSPTIEEGAIIKRSWWKRWEGDIIKGRRRPDLPPECVMVLQSYDTAFEEGEENDYSARTTWGVFERKSEDWSEHALHLVLLERWKARVGLPELCKEAWQSYKEYRPERVIVEKRASGYPLIRELRKRKVPVRPFDPKSRSKTARAHAASSVFELGGVYYMDTASRFADDVINDCAEFPNGEHDDIVDTVVQACLYLRWRLWINTTDDMLPDEEALQQARGERKKKFAGSYGSSRRRRAA
jgi:predicted phage terminase large subunit-like protein